MTRFERATLGFGSRWQCPYAFTPVNWCRSPDTNRDSFLNTGLSRARLRSARPANLVREEGFGPSRFSAPAFKASMATSFHHSRELWWRRKDSNFRIPDGEGVLQTPVVAAGPRRRNLAVSTSLELVSPLSGYTGLANQRASCRPHSPNMEEDQRIELSSLAGSASFQDWVADHSARIFRNFWWAPRGSNPHSVELVPKTSASANSARGPWSTGLDSNQRIGALQAPTLPLGYRYKT